MPDELELSPQNRVAIQVDRALCIGSGDCVATVVDGHRILVASLDDIITAATNCPVSAIFVAGEDGDLYP